MTNTSNRDAIYLRKSRKDIELEQQGEGETLSRHLHILEDLCKKMKIVVSDEDIYKEVVSGESIEARPEMQKLLEKIELGYYRSVLVVEIERLARGDSIDQGIILRAFKLSNTKIITPIKTYDFKEEIDEEYMEFGLFMSRREYKIITQRLQRGRILSAKEGKFVGSRAPFGYKRVKLIGQKGYSLEIDEEKANVVRTIFDLYVNQNYQPSNIYRYLNSLGLPAPQNDIWTVSGVNEILKNPIYKGYILFNERVTSKEISKGKLSNSRHTNKGNLKELVYVKGLHEAIVSKDIFDKAQQIKQTRNVVPQSNRDYSLKNPLAGILKCKICGRTLYKYPMRGESRIRCKNDNCKNVSSFLNDVEREILITLEQWLKDKKINLNIKKGDSSIKFNYNLLKSKENDLQLAKTKKEKIYDLFEEQIYDKKTFFERTQKIDSLIENLENEIERIKEDIKRKEDIVNESNNFIPKLEFLLANYYKTDSAAEKNKMLKNVIDKIEYLKKDQGNKWHVSQFELWIYPKLPKE